MIASIAGLDDIGDDERAAEANSITDCDAAGLFSGFDWFDCPVLRPSEMFAAIKRCGSLDGQSLNLFASLERPPRSGLVKLYLLETCISRILTTSM